MSSAPAACPCADAGESLAEKWQDVEPEPGRVPAASPGGEPRAMESGAVSTAARCTLQSRSNRSESRSLKHYPRLAASPPPAGPPSSRMRHGLPRTSPRLCERLKGGSKGRRAGQVHRGTAEAWAARVCNSLQDCIGIWSLRSSSLRIHRRNVKSPPG